MHAQGVVERAWQNGYLQTLSGRRRWLPDIKSTSWEKRGHDERVAVNGTVSGSAADCVKGAQVQLLSDLREEGLSQHCRMMVQVCLGRGGKGWAGRTCQNGGSKAEPTVTGCEDMHTTATHISCVCWLFVLATVFLPQCV